MSASLQPACEGIRELNLGESLHAFIRELYPINRSITGDGVRATLDRITQHIPIQRTEVPSGETAFDWTVPREWNVREAWVADEHGHRVIDVARHNLHLVSYSVPFRGRMTLEQLRPRLHSLPDRPDSIPFRTSYYRDYWGFCLTDRQLAALPDGLYDVCIDSELRDGSLTYGESFIPGKLKDEVLISAHVCHPSMCNDNLSSIAVGTYLAKSLHGTRPRYSYRFLFAPGTIGAVAWLSRNRRTANRIKHGLVLTCIGDSAPFTYKKTASGNATIDRAMVNALTHWQTPGRTECFSPYGYDERQYNSPGFNLPVGCLMRSIHGQFPEYHSSADNLDFVKPDKLEESLQLCHRLVDTLERDKCYVNRSPWGEPQLGKRGLYRPFGGETPPEDHMALLWVLNRADGSRSLLEIAELAQLPFAVIADAADRLREAGLLTERGTQTTALASAS
jgi:aminopeptidase-like protein